MPQVTRAKIDRPVFVVGCPRSGTTLLGVILDRHSELAITPETGFYDEIAPQLRSAKHDLKAVLNNWNRLPELGLEVDAVVKHLEQNYTHVQLFETLLALHAQARSKPCCGEKTPQHLAHVPQIIKDFPEARVVCVIRDGRDVALSLRSMPWWPHDLDSATKLWLKSIECSDSFAEQYPQHFVTIRYEQLVARPEATVKEVMTLLGLEFQPGQLGSTASDVVLPRSMAWKGLALEPVDDSRAGRRQSVASSDDINFLNDTLGTTLIRLGYPAESS